MLLKYLANTLGDMINCAALVSHVYRDQNSTIHTIQAVFIVISQ